MNTIAYFKEHFNQAGLTRDAGELETIRQDAFRAFQQMGIPTVKHEEWKYTRISGLFNKDYRLSLPGQTSLSAADIRPIRLPGHEQANELVFVNGLFAPEHSNIFSGSLVVMPLAEASKHPDYKQLVAAHLGHSRGYQADGLNALNTAFAQDGIFVYVKKGQVTEHPVYVYTITDAREADIFSQPRSLMYVAENAAVQVVETFATLGRHESFTSQVLEIVVEKDAQTEYYKIQNDASHTNQVSTTHIRQVGKSYTHTVTVSLDGGIVRNNLNVVMEAAHCEAHLYGLYFQGGNTHVDNHTVVDNAQPDCLSNELYKGILDDEATGVFNGKIFVRPHAQKTNAYQTNKNVLLSAGAGVNTKPQLEIFADDVKCSHGCTVGQLDEEGLFYLRSRGISEQLATSLLLQGFIADIVEKIKPAAIRSHVEKLIAKRLALH